MCITYMHLVGHLTSNKISGIFVKNIVELDQKSSLKKVGYNKLYFS